MLAVSPSILLCRSTRVFLTDWGKTGLEGTATLNGGDSLICAQSCQIFEHIHQIVQLYRLETSLISILGVAFSSSSCISSFSLPMVSLYCSANFLTFSLYCFVSLLISSCDVS